MILIAFNIFNEEIYSLVTLYLAFSSNGFDETIGVFFYICLYFFLLFFMVVGQMFLDVFCVVFSCSFVIDKIFLFLFSLEHPSSK